MMNAKSILEACGMTSLPNQSAIFIARDPLSPWADVRVEIDARDSGIKGALHYAGPPEQIRKLNLALREYSENRCNDD